MKMRMLTSLLTRARSLLQRNVKGALTTMPLGFRGHRVSVVDKVTGVRWSGRAIWVINEHPRPGGESTIGFLFSSAGSPTLSPGSIVMLRSRRFATGEVDEIRGVAVHELH